MPTYEYKCDKCGKKEELFQTMSGKQAPTCCDVAMRDVIYGGNFILKGEGWPGQDLIRAKQDDYVRVTSKAARDAKLSGKVPLDAHIDFKDAERLAE